jgi:hypothetical protein
MVGTRGSYRPSLLWTQYTATEPIAIGMWGGDIFLMLGVPSPHSLAWGSFQPLVWCVG